MVTVFAVNSYSQEDVYKDYTDIGIIEGQKIPIEKIFQDRDKYHREIVIIEGKLSEIKFKNLVWGKFFTLFIVEDENGNNINVYARGTVKGLEEGSNIKVHGRYSKSKKFFFNKYKNVMKARKIQMNSL
jgi:hypothetical protein